MNPGLRWTGALRRRIGVRVSQAGSLAKEGLVDILFPHVCVGCGASPGSCVFFCAGCRERLSTPDPERLKALCPVFDAGITSLSALWYTEPGAPARRAIHTIKYSYAPTLALWAGAEAARSLVLPPRTSGASPSPTNARDERPLPTVLAPIPLHRHRRAERGFNQAELIAHGADTVLSLGVRRLLERVVARSSQTRVSARERRLLAVNTFRVRGDVANMRVILVDDVVTTGSTLHAAAGALLAAGAAEVRALALAVSRRPGSP